MSQSEEDIDEQMAAWAEDGENKNDADFEDPEIVAAVIAADREAAAAAKEEEFAADKAAVDKAAADKGKEKVTIDVDADEVKGKREIAKRSDIWKHFTEIKDGDGVVVKGRCKYCNHDIAAHPVNNELIKEFKDKAIIENNASKAQVEGSKATTTTAKTKTQPSRSSKSCKSKVSNSKPT